MAPVPVAVNAQPAVVVNWLPVTTAVPNAVFAPVVSVGVIVIAQAASILALIVPKVTGIYVAPSAAVVAGAVAAVYVRSVAFAGTAAIKLKLIAAVVASPTFFKFNFTC